VTDEIADHCLRLCNRMMERYGDDLLAVAAGSATPADAIAAIEG
jgi:hypothetical protein